MTIVGPQGRRLEVEVAGPEDGTMLVFHAGTPSAGRLYAPHVDAGAERGLRHLTYSRPGYGESDRHAARTVADCAEDVAAIADELGAEQLFVIGASGGGPHALACAALLGDRVLAAASVAGVAPADAEGLDWLAGMGQENLDEFAAARAGEQPLLEFLKQNASELTNANGPELHAALGELLSDVDRSVLTGEFADYLATAVKVALSNSVWGWFDDDLAFLRHWGFDLQSITLPVTIWQGKQDRFVPFGHGEWLARHVPSAQLQLRPEQGHLSLTIGAYPEILDDLIANAA